jgi:hypothetical protein
MEDQTATTQTPTTTEKKESLTFETEEEFNKIRAVVTTIDFLAAAEWDHTLSGEGNMLSELSQYLEAAARKIETALFIYGTNKTASGHYSKSLLARLTGIKADQG